VPSPTLGVCLIVRDVADHIGRCLASVAEHADEVIVTDTGSTDGTIEAVRRSCPRAEILTFLPESHPESFTRDVEDSWVKKLPGPFSGKSFLTDFAAARMLGWKKAQSDYLMWLDSDDTVEHPERLRGVVQHMKDHGVDMAMVNYDYEHDDAGNVTLRLPRERVVRKTLGSYWAQPVHEVLLPGGIGTFYEEINIKHHRKQWKCKPVVAHRNLKILVKWWEEQRRAGVKEDDLDPRMVFYLALEERFHWPEAAIDHFKRYVQKSGWDEERALAHLLSGHLHERAGRWQDAIASFSVATVEFPDNPDGFFGLARVAYFRKDWNKCVEWTERAFEVDKRGKRRPTMLMEDPHDRLWRPYVFFTAALVNTGQYKRCLEAADEGLKHAPEGEDGRKHILGNQEAARKNLTNMEEKKTTGSFGAFLQRSEPLENAPIDMPFEIRLLLSLQIWKRVLVEDAQRSITFLEALPKDLRNDPKVARALEIARARAEGRASSLAGAGEEKQGGTETSIPVDASSPAPDVEEVRGPPTDVSASGTNDEAGTIEVGKRLMKIVLWTGPAWEPWSPESLKTGIGGSETAAIHVARGLARRGHFVRILGMCAGRWDGVEYVHHEKALGSPDDFTCDVFITSRQPLVLAEAPFRALVNYVWVHDIHCGFSPRINEGLLRANKIFALSKWHREFLLGKYPFLSPDSLHVTRNGIDTRRFEREPQKVGKRIIVTSSPDRYLDRFMELWPRIRKEVPEAEAHLFYGFITWESMSKAAGDQEGLRKIGRYREMLSEGRKDGIVFHDRVGQEELAQAFSEARVWGYPTWFAETSCISAMEAQAAGCVPVTSALAALEETVRYGFLLKGRDSDDSYKDAFVRRVVSLLKDEKLRLGYAEAGRKHATKNLDWDGVAAEWEAIFAEASAAQLAQSILSLPRYGGL